MTAKTPHLFVIEDRGHSTPCHVWTRAINSSGYGIRKVGGVVVLAHRHAYESEVGPIAEGLEVDHLCRVRLCVNTDHFEIVTPAENRRRGTSSKITAAIADLIRVERRAGATTLELGQRYGIHPSTISRICHDQLWAEAA